MEKEKVKTRTLNYSYYIQATWLPETEESEDLQNMIQESPINDHFDELWPETNIAAGDRLCCIDFWIPCPFVKHH